MLQSDRGEDDSEEEDDYNPTDVSEVSESSEDTEESNWSVFIKTSRAFSQCESLLTVLLGLFIH